jgi:periplasmic protein TonB
MHALRLPIAASGDDRMSVAVFIAIIIHAAVVLGVSFEPEPIPENARNSLDIILVQTRDKAKDPEDAKLLAQRSTNGGADEDSLVRPTTPVASTMDASRAEPVASAAPTPPPAPSAPQRAIRDHVEPIKGAYVMSVAESAAQDQVAAAPRPRPRAKPRRSKLAKVAQDTSESEQTTPRISASQLVTQGLSMASMTSELDKRVMAYTNKPKRKWISSRTREVKYAAYMESWRAKVERVGNLNYPDEARRRRMSGKLQLDVSLKSDGSINRITVRRSSGKRVLDDAAIRIVKLAAPFSKFPESFAKEVDILHIERTWQFLSSNRLASR